MEEQRTLPKEKNGRVESKDTSSSSKKLDKTDDVIKTKEIKKNKNRNGKVGILSTITMPLMFMLLEKFVLNALIIYPLTAKLFLLPFLIHLLVNC